jgi:hypothetical protein
VKDSLALDAGSAQALPAILFTLQRYGFTAVQSFDLRSALAAHPGCACPYHGTEQCTCQYIVLLVYPLTRATQAGPVVVTLHSHDTCACAQCRCDQTHVALVEPAFDHALSANGEVTAAERVMIALIETAYGLAATNRASVPTHASI